MVSLGAASLHHVYEYDYRNPVPRSCLGLEGGHRPGLWAVYGLTLVVGGYGDAMVEVNNIATEYFALPEHTFHFHILHGIEHSPNVEMPQLLVGLLARFVDKVKPAETVATAAG